MTRHTTYAHTTRHDTHNKHNKNMWELGHERAASLVTLVVVLRETRFSLVLATTTRSENSSRYRRFSSFVTLPLTT